MNTSAHEGMPMSVMEAMALGVPVIAPAVGGIPEMIHHGGDGFLMDGHDSGAYAEMILKLYEDDELRERISAAARRNVRDRFSAENMARRYRDLYAATFYR